MKPERFGNYVLFQRLGKGGMAEVFLARAQSMGGFEKLLAIKRLLPPYNIDEQIISMLGDEARLSVWLNHPNIVQVLDFGRVDQTYYIAMEYVQGCDLCDLIRPNGQTPGRALPMATALYVMIQVADALSYAHTRRNRRGEPLNIVHRDVSPHNVLISSEGQVKLADFGLARASISVHHSAAGVIRGKFSYMPKEQARGKDIDHRIDLFAAGVTLYEALTGVKPYTSTTLAQQLYQLEQPVPPPSAHQTEITEAIDDITLQAMSPDPETRYTTAEELSRDLRHALAKYSSFNQEAARLASLVRRATGVRPQGPPAPLPFMSLADLRVPEGSLIEDELRAVQQALQQQTSEQAVPTAESPRIDDDDDEGETSRFDPPTSAPSPSSKEQDDAMDGLKTVALPANGPSGGATPGRPRATGPLPSTELLDTDDRSQSSERRASAEQEVSTSEQVRPRDSEERPRRPSQDSLDDARTIQRSPEEALAAFQRALDERDRRKRRHLLPDGHGDSRLGLRATLVLSAGGLLLFGMGAALGWLLPRQPPAPSITLKKFCPESRPCPPCSSPMPATDARTDVGIAGAESPAPDTGPTAPRKPRRGSAAASTSGKGFLVVTTGGAAARVYIDDRTQSLPAPVTRLPLTPGVHRVRIYSEQHHTFSDTQWVTITAGQTATLAFGLK